MYDSASGIEVAAKRPNNVSSALIEYEVQLDRLASAVSTLGDKLRPISQGIDNNTTVPVGPIEGDTPFATELLNKTDRLRYLISSLEEIHANVSL